MKKEIEKIDLTQYIKDFEQYFSQKRPIFIDGDRNQHFKMIEQLDKYEFKAPPKTQAIQPFLNYIKKFGFLKIDEVFEILKIVRYFYYLKQISFQNKLGEWIDKIEIPVYFEELNDFFNEKGEFREQKDDRLLNLTNRLSQTKNNISSTLKRLLFTKKLEPYFVDKQIHYINEEEALLVRGGFNHVLKANIIGRSSGGHFYVVPESIRSLKTQVNQIHQDKESIYYEYAKQFSDSLNKQILFLQFLDKTFTKFDHYQARVFFAQSKGTSFIKPSDDNKIRLVDFAHPALHNPKPISVDFSKKVLMITGVNAGGKTMLLKSILSATFLSKYLIPMKIDKQRSHIGNFKEIESIIDDPQSVGNDISTFAGRMVAFSNILHKKNILIGVDEVELGTDSDEAASLFKVLILELMAKNSKIVITTHHKRLASLMAYSEDVELMAALYDEKQRTPTYEFLQGIVGKSYAFETALRYGISPNLVKEAKKVYGEDQEKLNEIIEKSSQLELELKQKALLLDKQINKQARLIEELEDGKENYFKGLKHKRNELDSVYYGAIEEAKRAVKAKLIPDKHRYMNKAHKALPKNIKEEKTVDKAIAIGSSVKYRDNRGIVLSINGAKAMLEVNGMRLQVKLNELKKVEALPKKKTKTEIKKPKSKRLAMKLDLHGKRADEAEEELDSFLSDALITGVDEVIVYHGIGTGKLSYVVKEFLLQHPSVKGFEDAPIHLGGYGAKIIFL